MRRLLAGLLLAALAACDDPPSAAPTSAAPPPGYAAELADLDRQIASARRHAAKQPQSWLALEQVALLQMTRAQLSGDFHDYRAAGDTLAQAGTLAPPPGGPCRSRLRHALLVHRVPQAAALLEACRNPLDPLDPADLLLAGDVARQQGRYAEALRLYRQAALYRDGPEPRLRLALLHAQTGAVAEADALLAQAESDSAAAGAQLRAWLAPQRGLLQLDRGRLDQARGHYQRAAALLPGWWLVEEHLAELLALEGRSDQARQAYAAIVARTGNPELMDALAQLEEEAGHAPAARDWRARARSGWHERLALLPEAAYGHAQEHFLQAPEPGPELLELARRNAALRPDGEALALLALAQLRAGDCTAALPSIAAALDSGWSGAPAHYTAHEVLRACGRVQEAETQRKLALALNPRAPRMYARAWLDGPDVAAQRP